jgi:hypothetical protein
MRLFNNAAQAWNHNNEKQQNYDHYDQIQTLLNPQHSPVAIKQNETNNY